MRYDVLVVGGGSAGCVLAARLSEQENRTVCLVEAGPDYGPHPDGAWPDDLLDPGEIPDVHQWDPDESPYSPLRAKVIGGCSAHNACMLVRPPTEDYAWAGELDPYLTRAFGTMAPAPFFFGEDELTPWFEGVVAACAEHGLSLLADPNDPAEAAGIATGPFNITHDARWNTAFAYLDPARHRANLTVRGHRLVDRVLFEGERAVGAVAGEEILHADVVVLAAGACGSPAILLRSGVGPESQLDALGIAVVAPLEGVGANLQDHATAKLAFEPSEELRERTGKRAPVPFSNGLVKAATDRCTNGFDVHLLPITGRTGESAHITVALMLPESRGHVRLRSTDPGVSPVIEHRLLSDPGEADRATVKAGLELAHGLAAAEPLRRLGRPVELPDDERIDSTLGIYFHPVGTCAIGSVVERDGRVRGLENLYVADASIMPTIPRANTHLTTLALAELIAELV
ncbi:MAG TPA: GMC family oxidoreductase [Gaiellaceae bacterium]